MNRHSLGAVVMVAAVLTMIIPSLAISQTVASNVSADSVLSTSTGGEVHSDFNGDGYEDLSIGVPGEDIGSVTAAGAVHVIYGGSSTLQTSSPADQFWHQNSPGVEDTVEERDNFSWSLATGDFNGDGYSDLAIGVPSESIGAFGSAGAVNVLYGSSSGLRSSAAADGTGRADQFWHQNSPGVEDNAENYDQFGFSLADGDFNNDGYDDLATGVPGESIGTFNDAGAINVLYGSASGLQTSSPADQFWHQDSPGVEDSIENNEGHLPTSLAGGDFDNDAYSDLAIGFGEEKIEGVWGFSHGAVEILYGSSSGLQATSPADQFWHQDSPGVNNSAELNDIFGWSVASGDYNGDGYYDLAIGVRGEGIDGKGAAGAVNVIYGSGGGLQTSSPSDQFWHQDSLGVESTLEAGEQLGWSLASGDFNNDGRDDLAIGVHYENIGEGAAGAVNVLYGSNSGLQTSSPADQFWHQDSPGVEDTSESFDNFGDSLTSGDYNNDGYSDLAVGVHQEDFGNDVGGEIHGAVHVIYGTGNGLQTSSLADQFWHQDSPGVNDAVEHGDRFSYSLS